jgi:hypothetical protein
VRFTITALSLALVMAGSQAAYAQTSTTAHSSGATRLEARRQFAEEEATHKARLDSERAAAPGKLAAREEQRRRFSEKEALHKKNLDAERAASPGILATRRAERTRSADLEKVRRARHSKP